MKTTQAIFSHSLRENPLGEARKNALRLDFNRKLKLEFHGTRVISHSRYVIFQMAELAVPRALSREILDRIRQLRFLPIPSRPGLCC
jgi:hypothetical protein